MKRLGGLELVLSAVVAAGAAAHSRAVATSPVYQGSTG